LANEIVRNGKDFYYKRMRKKTKNTLHITLTLTEAEHTFFMKKANNKTFWHIAHEEIINAINKLPEPAEAEVCVGNKNKVIKNIEIPSTLARTVNCHAKKLGLTPGALIYRIVFAKNLIDVLKEK
jgi:hypothetical protein